MTQLCLMDFEQEQIECFNQISKMIFESPVVQSYIPQVTLADTYNVPFGTEIIDVCPLTWSFPMFSRSTARAQPDTPSASLSVRWVGDTSWRRRQIQPALLRHTNLGRFIFWGIPLGSPKTFNSMVCWKKTVYQYCSKDSFHQHCQGTLILIVGLTCKQTPCRKTNGFWLIFQGLC